MAYEEMTGTGAPPRPRPDAAAGAARASPCSSRRPSSWPSSPFTWRCASGPTRLSCMRTTKSISSTDQPAASASRGFLTGYSRRCPGVCPHLPGRGYASLGFVYEEGRICRSACRCGATRESTASSSIARSATPARCATRPRRSPGSCSGCRPTPSTSGLQEVLLRLREGPEVQRRVRGARDRPPDEGKPSSRRREKLDLLDRYVVYPVAIAIMRERLMMLGQRFAPLLQRHRVGTGTQWTRSTRTRSCSTSRCAHLPRTRANAPVGFSVDLAPEAARRACSCTGTATTRWSRSATRARLSAPGTTPPTIDLAAIGRLEKWLLTLEPPKYPVSDRRSAKAARGAALYAEYCAGCHGASGRDFSGACVGKVHAHRQRRSAPIAVRARFIHRTTLAVISRRSARATHWRFHATSARPSATPTCRSTASGCARPICTTARCPRCVRCSSRREAPARSSIAATTSTTRRTSASCSNFRRRGGRQVLRRYDTSAARQLNAGHEGKALRHRAAPRRQGCAGRVPEDFLGAAMDATRTSGWRWQARSALAGAPAGRRRGARRYYGWYKFFREEPQADWVTATPEMRFRTARSAASATQAFRTGSSTCCRGCSRRSCRGRAATPRSACPGSRGSELPIGFTKKIIGFPRVGQQLRRLPHDELPRGAEREPASSSTPGPGHTLNLEAFFRFLVDCAQGSALQRRHPDARDRARHRSAVGRQARLPLPHHSDDQEAADRARRRSSHGSIARTFPTGAAGATTR